MAGTAPRADVLFIREYWGKYFTLSQTSCWFGIPRYQLYIRNDNNPKHVRRSCTNSPTVVFRAWLLRFRMIKRCTHVLFVAPEPGSTIIPVR
jgi:hypothetical protein